MRCARSSGATVCLAKTPTVLLRDGTHDIYHSASVAAQDDDEQQVVLLMDRLESNLSTEMRSWSQYDYEILARVLTPVQVIVPGCLLESRRGMAASPSVYDGSCLELWSACCPSKRGGRAS